MTHQPFSESPAWHLLTDADWASVAAVIYGHPVPDDQMRVAAIRATPEGERLLAEIEKDARAGGVGTGHANVVRLRQRAELIVKRSGVAGRSEVVDTHVPQPRRGEMSHLVRRDIETLRLGKRFLQRQGVMGTQTLRLLGIFPLHRTVVAVGAIAGLALLVYTGVRQPPTVAGPTKTYVTRVGQRATMRLADGTQVTLAPQTQLVVDPGFGTVNRDVRLSGQAYFNVAHAKGQPFSVKTGSVTSRVLGTEFTIRHYAKDPTVLIAVRSGRVTSGLRTSVVVGANMVARITDSTVVLTPESDLREYMAWTNGQLVFSDVSASEITTVLGHWYGLTFQFADSATARRSLFGVFDDRLTKQSVLQDLEMLLEARMIFHGDVITVVAKRATAVPRVRPNEYPTRMEVGR